MKSKVHVELFTPDDGHLDEVGITVTSEDGSNLSYQDIIEAIAEALLMRAEFGIDLNPVVYDA